MVSIGAWSMEGQGDGSIKKEEGWTLSSLCASVGDNNSGRHNIQDPLIRISHLLVDASLVSARRGGIRLLHLGRVVKGEVDVVDGAAAVSHGDVAWDGS